MLFGAVQITKNADPDKSVYTDYGTGFDSCSEFSLPDGSAGKNFIIFGVHMSSSVHVNNEKKFRTQELDDALLTAEAQYSFNFSR